MISAFANTWRIPELRDRILFTLAMIIIVRLGVHVTLPGVDGTVIKAYMDSLAKMDPTSAAGGLTAMLQIFSGGGLQQAGIFALGIMPYISASIMIQLMTAVVPKMARLAREDNGRQKITQYTRYLTIVLSVIQSTTIATALQSTNYGGQALVFHPGLGFILLTILTLTTGSAFIMWLGEQISERGIGNGMSLIIFVGIVVGLPRAVLDLYEKISTAAWGPFTGLVVILLLVLMIAVVAFIVFVEGGQRRIPVQYAKRVVGRRVMGGQSSYLPLRVNSGGVIPPIFASSLLAFPATAALMFGSKYAFVTSFSNAVKFGEPLYNLAYVVLIILFAFFYVGIVFNPTELADNMRKNGGFIPGIRPGRTTSDHVSKILKRLTFIGAIYLAIVCLLPEWLITGVHLDHIGVGIGAWFDRHFPQWFLKGLGVQFYFGGTSLLIVVGVAMDTVQQLEAQLVMRNYEGFAKKGRLRGRR